MSTNEVDAPARPARPERAEPRGFADRWPFRRKLNLLVGVPLAVIAVLLSYLVSDLIEESNTTESAARVVRDSATVARLVDRVEAEHQQAILLSARFESGYSKPSLAAYRTAQQAVDDQVETVRDTFGDRLPQTETQALREVEGLSSLRQSVERGYLPADNIDPAYTSAAKGVIDGLGLDRTTSLASTFTGNLLDSLLRADAAHGAFETSVFSATTGDTNALIEFTNAVGAYDLYSHQADRFNRFATQDQARKLAGIEHTAAQQRIAESFAELQIDPTQLEAGTQDEIRKAVQDALSEYPAYPDQAAARLKITTSLIDDIAARADEASNEAQWRALLLLSGTLVGFALWIAFSVLVRRSVIRPVQSLTGAAREVADVAGRELARVADDDAEDDGPPRLRDMPVTARDEIGDLAEAFNNVQTTAGALLERQVLSRRNVAEMFGNVGRRVSNLTTRQLALIDAVERGETDPALLERLYSIDHIAVRLRRNADSLMLLAGIRETALDAEPTALTNVVRAALGQIEGYQRVRLYAGTDAVVEPDIIGDLTLMVAELLENAVSFSPERSPVEVTVRSGDEAAYVVITDHGLGMSAERLAEENARLIRRERLDVVPTKVLGLFVVGALARRWEIGVELTRTPGGGVTAEVKLPAALLLTTSPVPANASGSSAMDSADGGTNPASGGAGEPAAVGASVASEAKPASVAAEAKAVPVPAATEAKVVPAAAEAKAMPVPAASEAKVVPAAAEAKVVPVASEVKAMPVPAAAEAKPASPAVSGPVPSATVEDRAAAPDADPDHSTTLPRRVPRRESPVTDRKAPLVPAARTESPPAQDSSRPLRRRVRGATLRTTAGAAQVLPQEARERDAEAVRSALEEFEAAVERAQRDSDTGNFARPGNEAGPAGASQTMNPPQDQNHLPEGAEQ
ncbi:ATP-binding protein [Streptomyces sp. NPDC001435]|uniref:ATP-binding protein n=1 Tax=Streptomyces sp. NPDC001435 TaxID=3364576 RepID=UPI00367F6EA1